MKIIERMKKENKKIKIKKKKNKDKKVLKVKRWFFISYIENITQSP
jgi:hypothetical protein